MKNLKKIIGENLADLRKKQKLTQLELAERFNYSDKSVSKWEKGETLPDIEVLQELCDFYHVTLDYLTHEITDKNHDDYKVKDKAALSQKIVLTCLICSIIWILVTIIYVWMLLNGNSHWPVFLWAIPASAITVLLANRFYFKLTIVEFIFITLFIWSTLAAIFIETLKYNVWPIFILGVPMEISTFLWWQLKQKKNK